MEFSFAHFSDVHLGPLTPRAIFKDFALKRLSGGLNWFTKRRRIQIPAIAFSLREDILLHQLDHLVCTGDVVNIAAHEEFPHAAEYLKSFSEPHRLSLVPGNHDAYVEVPFENGWKYFSPWMKTEFPYVVLRKNIAFIGLSSALPQPLFRATGVLGERQLNALAVHLADLKSRGFCRVVMIHHPPLPGQTSDRKALKDAAALSTVLIAQGAELVLHGHLHENLKNHIQTETGPCPIIGVASASSNGRNGHQLAAWNQFFISRVTGGWRIAMQRHDFDRQSQTFKTGNKELLM